MPLAGYVLGIDFGTSNTVGVLRYPDGRAESLLFDGSPMLLSGVCLDEHGQFLTGRDAAHVARVRPESFEPNPKRRVDDGTVLLGGRDVPVPQLVAAVLARVMSEARRATGSPPERVVLTHPVAWGPRRLDVLRQAAATAGIPSALLVAEPVAASFSFVALPRLTVAPGQSMVVYDFGGGTFDATVVRRSAGGFDVVAYEGLDDVGGLDIDEAIVNQLGSALGLRAPEVWQRLRAPGTAADRRAARLLWEDVRQAKETLSRMSTVHIHVPLIDDDLPLGRDQLEALARPLLNQTVGTTLEAVRSAGTRPGGLAAVLLVGGSSRIPLVSALLHQQLGVVPTVVENPELVVAQGAVVVGAVGMPVPVAPGAPGVGGPVRTPTGPGTVPTAPAPVPGPGHGPGNGPGAPRRPDSGAVGGRTSGSVLGAGGLPPGTGGAPPGTGGQPSDVGGPVSGAGRGGSEPLGAPSGTPSVAPPVAVARGRRTGRWIAAVAAVSVVVLAVCGGLFVHWLASAENDSGTGDTEAAVACIPELAFLGAETGPGADLGVRVRHGVQLAVADHNRRTDGCDVTLTRYDTGGDETRAAELASSIALNETTVGVIGPLRPAELSTASKAYEEAGLAQITPVGDASALAQWKTFHQVIGDEDSPNLVARSYLLDTLEANRVYVADDGTDHSRALAALIDDGLGDASAGSGSLPEDPAALGDVVGRIRATDASAVFYVGGPTQAGRLRKVLTKAGAGDVRLVGTAEIDDPAFFREAGDLAEGTELLGPYAPLGALPATFRTEYKAKFGQEPGRYSAEAYDAATVVLDGIDAGKTDRREMLEFVNAYDAEGLTKRVKFNELGDLATPSMWLYRARNGAFTGTGKLTR